MTLRLYLFGMYLAMAIALLLIAILIRSVNPLVSPSWIVALFYLSLFIFILSILAIVLFKLKVKLSNKEVIFAHIIPTFRQSALISIFFVGILFLQQVRVLTLFTFIIYLVAVFLIELFFRYKK